MEGEVRAVSVGMQREKERVQSRIGKGRDVREVTSAAREKGSVGVVSEVVSSTWWMTV